MSAPSVPCSTMFSNVGSPSFSNALSPIDVTDSGTVNSVRALQPANALAPIDVTDSGMVNDCNAEHPANALAPIEVMDWDITIFFTSLLR